MPIPFFATKNSILRIKTDFNKKNEWDAYVSQNDQSIFSHLYDWRDTLAEDWAKVKNQVRKAKKVIIFPVDPIDPTNQILIESWSGGIF